MQDSPVPLVKNTGKYLKSKILTFKSIRLSSGMTNGSMDLNGVLSINPVMAYNPSELQGLLVHEVHHDLCFHSGSSKAWGSDLSGTALYIDEFVAHLKQYSVTRPAASEAARIESVNKVLAINYRKAVDDWTRSGFRLVESFADLGDFAVPDNAKRERCLYHGCAPTRGRAVSVRA
jgi:predicted metal-dependent peptidase